MQGASVRCFTSNITKWYLENVTIRMRFRKKLYHELDTYDVKNARVLKI